MLNEQNFVLPAAVCVLPFLINLQVMHTMSENPAINQSDSLLKCHKTEKGDKSLLLIGE